MSSSLEKRIMQLSNHQLIPELRDLIKKVPAAQLCKLMEEQLSRSNACSLWSSLLRGFDESEDSIEKRYACVMSFLKQINKVELSYKQIYDLLSILFLDLPSFPIAQLIDLAEHSIVSLKLGDPKCVAWKDLLPEVMNILITKSVLPVNGVLLSGNDYRSNMVKNLCNIQWPAPVLTPIGNMFRNMNLTNDEITTVLTKFSYSFKHLDPLELPALAFQLFSMCNTAAHIMIPIISLQRYFYDHYYKKMYADMESENTDLNSIDKFSDKELREAEETIFNHLSYCTQFKIKEFQILVVFRNLVSSPDVILTPFVLNSILSMAQINREPDIRLSSSLILPYLRNVIVKNEEEKQMVKVSAWCRDTLQTKQVNLENIFTILIDQNKDGKDFVTPGLVNLAFTLIRAKNSPELNAIAISFFRNFLKKRFVFGQGIIKNIAEWMILEQDANQYSECLTILSNTETFTVSECVRTIKYVLDFFLYIPGLTAMRMMSFILPIIRISHVVRDSFIDIMKKAMYSRNSQRTAVRPGSFFTQQSISGFSLMSQTVLGSNNNPQRHFDMLTLEVIGILRSCFNQSLEIKTTLYESLLQSVEINPKLIPHVLQFIDWHFRSYFEVDELKCEIKFDKIVRHQTTGENDIEVCDSLGKLTNFVVFCVLSCNKLELNYDTSILMDLFDKLIKMTCIITPEDLGITGTITQTTNQIVLQYVGLIEALMNYALWTSNRENNNVQTLHRLFKCHQKICKEHKALLENQYKKAGKKGKDVGAESQSQNCTINGTVSKRIVFKPESVYDLPTIERFLRLLYDDCISFALDTYVEPLQADRHLVQFVTRTAVDLIGHLRNEPEYKQLSHSRRCFKNLVNVSKFVYERCIKRLAHLWNTFDVVSAYYSVECLRQCLLTANSVFKRKFDTFLKEIDYAYASDDNAKKITAVIQEATETAIKDSDLSEQLDGNKIPVALFQCLEILYDYIPYDDDICMESYHWIFNFCQVHELKTKELAIANKILFSQRIKTHTGVFFTNIAMGLQKCFQKINIDCENDPQFELKSISEANAGSTLVFLMNVVCKQIVDVEYFILKAKSLQTKVKITSEADREQSIEQLKITEKSICSQLIHIAATLLQLTNSSIPLGTMMDSLIKSLMEFYICLTNLTKHLISRHSCVPISFQGTKFDQLLRAVGKPLATNVYDLITYLEENILQDNSKRKDAKANKAKILKETKLLPKLILRMENFNKFVILLSKKTQAHISHYLHIGTVRDFRIKTSELKDAINRSLIDNRSIDDDADDYNQTEEEIEDPSDIENESLEESRTMNITVDSHSPKRTTTANKTTASIRASSKEVVDKENNSETSTQVLKNLEKLNAKVRKKKSSDGVETEEPKVKKRKTRKCKNSK